MQFSSKRLSLFRIDTLEPGIFITLIITMYHHNMIPSQQLGANSSRCNMYTNPDTTRSVDYSRSPNAVTASPSPTSPRIKIANVNAEQRCFDHAHEIDIQELEAEADFKEYVMYQRIMQHRSSRASSLTGAPVLTPPTLPLSATFHPNPSLLSHSMVQRLRDNARDRQDSFYNDNDQADGTTNNENEDDLESEVGIFELDM